MKDSMGWLMTILLGVVGAIVGGWIFGLFGGASVSGINLQSIVVATVGSVIVLFVAGWLQRRG